MSNAHENFVLSSSPLPFGSSPKRERSREQIWFKWQNESYIFHFLKWRALRKQLKFKLKIQLALLKMIPFLTCTGVKSFSRLQDGELRPHHAPLIIQLNFGGQKAGAIKRCLHKFPNKIVAMVMSVLASPVMIQFWAGTRENFRIFAEKKKRKKTATTLLVGVVITNHACPLYDHCMWAEL